MKQTDTVRREAARIEKIYSVTTEDSVTLYWEKPEGAADCEYRISCGEEQKGITDKTHITIDGLEAETEYIFQVEAVDRGEKAVLPSASKQQGEDALPSSAKLQSKDGEEEGAAGCDEAPL